MESIPFECFLNIDNLRIDTDSDSIFGINSSSPQKNQKPIGFLPVFDELNQIQNQG